jgi:hypothetical protein
MSIAPARLKNVNAPDVIKGPSDAPSPVLCDPPRPWAEYHRVGLTDNFGKLRTNQRGARA